MRLVALTNSPDTDSTCFTPEFPYSSWTAMSDRLFLFSISIISIFNGILSRSLYEGERYTCDLNVGRTDQDLYVSVDFIPSLSQVLQLVQELSSLTH